MAQHEIGLTMKTQIFTANGTHKLATQVNSTSTITFEGSLGGATAKLQFVGNFDIEDGGVTVGKHVTLLHGQHRAVFVKIAGGSNVALTVKTSNVE